MKHVNVKTWIKAHIKKETELLAMENYTVNFVLFSSFNHAQNFQVVSLLCGKLFLKHVIPHYLRKIRLTPFNTVKKLVWPFLWNYSIYHKSFYGFCCSRFSLCVYQTQLIHQYRVLYCTVGWIKFLETVASHGACSECVETLQKWQQNVFCVAPVHCKSIKSSAQTHR